MWVVDVQGRREDRRRASIFSVTLQRLGSGGPQDGVRLKVHGGGDGGGCVGLGAAAKAAVGCAAASAPLECMARSTGNHCGGHASEWLTSTRLLATLVFVMCGMEAVQMAATTPMRSARKLKPYLFAYTFRWGGLEGTLQGQDARYPGTRQSSRKRVAQLIAASLRPGSSGGVAA